MCNKSTFLHSTYLYILLFKSTITKLKYLLIISYSFVAFIIISFSLGAFKKDMCIIEYSRNILLYQIKNQLQFKYSRKWRMQNCKMNR